MPITLWIAGAAVFIGCCTMATAWLNPLEWEDEDEHDEIEPRP